MRLGILSALAVNESLAFNDLKKLMQTTDGNLSVHARKLEEAGYVACTKSFEGRVPKTEYAITPSDGERSSATSTTWKRSSARRGTARPPRARRLETAPPRATGNIQPAILVKYT